MLNTLMNMAALFIFFKPNPHMDKSKNLWFNEARGGAMVIPELRPKLIRLLIIGLVASVIIGIYAKNLLVFIELALVVIIFVPPYYGFSLKNNVVQKHQHRD